MKRNCRAPDAEVTAICATRSLIPLPMNSVRNDDFLIHSVPKHTCDKPNKEKEQAMYERASVNTYIALLIDLWPLILGAFVIALLQGWRGVKRSYLYRTPMQCICNIIISSAIMACAAVGVALMLPLLGLDTTPELQLGVTIFTALGGVKFIEALIHWKSGYKLVDLMDPSDIDELRKKMSPEQRERHRETCPFKDDCAACAGCTKVCNEHKKENEQ